MKDDGIVADTNIMKYYYDDVSHDENSFRRSLIDTICDNCGIVMDDQIKYEYLIKIRTIGFRDWLGTMMLERKIDLVNERNETKLSSRHKNIIHKKYGMPRNDSRDIHFILCANHTIIKYILTNDIHFFDPKMANATSEVIEEIKNNRGGQLCRYLERELGILIGLPNHCHTTLCERGIITPIITE